MATALAPLVAPTVGAAHPSCAARPGVVRPRRRSRRRRLCPSGAAEEALKSVTGAAEPAGAALRAEVGAITAAAIAAGSAFFAAAADAARPPPSPSRRCVHAIIVSVSFHRMPFQRKRACHSVRVSVCACARAPRIRHVCTRMERRERERERERERGAREADYIVYGKMQHDRAGHARHEGPVLPSGEREPGTQLRAGL